jgi:hypothetical protein
MWLMTRYGFYSVTCARQEGNRAGAAVNPGIFQVRARVKAHLENLIDRFPALLGECEILETPTNDYLWRIFVPRDTWCEISAYLADDITYDNFKSECARQVGDQSFGYLPALHDVWSVMGRMQRQAHGTGPYGAGRASSRDGFHPLDYATSARVEPLRPAEPPREPVRSAKPERARGRALPIERTGADLDLLPVVGEPMALVVVDGDHPEHTIGVIERPERWASDAAAYAAAVKRKRLHLIARPRFLLCGWDGESRKRVTKARIPLVR